MTSWSEKVLNKDNNSCSFNLPSSSQKYCASCLVSSWISLIPSSSSLVFFTAVYRKRQQITFSYVSLPCALTIIKVQVRMLLPTEKQKMKNNHDTWTNSENCEEMSFGPFFNPFSSSLSFPFRVLTSSVILSTDSLANRNKKATSTWHVKKAGIKFRIRICDQKALSKRIADSGRILVRQGLSIYSCHQRIVLYHIAI